MLKFKLQKNLIFKKYLCYFKVVSQYIVKNVSVRLVQVCENKTKIEIKKYLTVLEQKVYKDATCAL